MSATPGSAVSPQAAEGTPVGPARFRDLMAGICAPVTVVTSACGDAPCGATASSLAALSQEPPLITVAFDRRSTLLRQIRAAGRFGVNLLCQGQEDLARRFAARGASRFPGVSWHYDTGLPRLDGAAGWMACDLNRTVSGGDHLLLFGLVTAASRTELPPLIYAHRTFGTHSRFDERPRPLIADQIAACSY